MVSRVSRLRLLNSFLSFDYENLYRLQNLRRYFIYINTVYIIFQAKMRFSAKINHRSTFSAEAGAE